MLSTKTLRVDVSQETSFVYTICKQYDHLSRRFRVLITDKGIPISLNGKEQIRIRMWAEGELDPYVDKWLDEPWEDGLPVLTLTSFMLSKIGVVDFEFVIQEIGSASTISTRIQHLSIQKSLINYDGLVASDDFDVLSNLISQAITIPDLIADFSVSQDEINALADKITADINAYQKSFTKLSSDTQDLIDTLQTYLNSAISAENTRADNENKRIAAEQKRQSDTTTAIAQLVNEKNQAILEITTAKTNVEQATSEAQAVTEETKQIGQDVALQGQEAVDKVNAAIQNLDYSLINIDGGDASTIEDDYTNVYDGGGA